MNFLLDVYIHLTDKYLYEMANMQPIETGIPYIIYVSWKGGVKHGPRIKVSNISGRFALDDNFTMTIDKEPRLIGKCKVPNHVYRDISDWVKLNYDHLMNIWHNGDTMTSSFISNRFKKI